MEFAINTYNKYLNKKHSQGNEAILFLFVSVFDVVDDVVSAVFCQLSHVKVLIQFCYMFM